MVDARADQGLLDRTDPAASSQPQVGTLAARMTPPDPDAHFRHAGEEHDPQHRRADEPKPRRQPGNDHGGSKYTNHPLGRAAMRGVIVDFHAVPSQQWREDTNMVRT